MTSYGDTSGTLPDPETGAEGDSNQLEQEDTLLDRGSDSVLDEGYSPPDHRPSHHRLETEREQYAGESLDDRLAQEEPEVWETEGPAAGTTEADRAGRLEARESELSGAPATSVLARDVGIAGSAASAEEAAMHLVDEDEETSDDEEPND